MFLANLGPVAAFTARATFAKNFFEAGGVEALGNDGFADAAALVAGFKASGAKLAALCSSDAVYAEQGLEAAKSLAAAGAHLYRRGPSGRAWRRNGARPGRAISSIVGSDMLAQLRDALQGGVTFLLRRENFAAPAFILKLCNRRKACEPNPDPFTRRSVRSRLSAGRASDNRRRSRKPNPDLSTAALAAVRGDSAVRAKILSPAFCFRLRLPCLLPRPLWPARL